MHFHAFVAEFWLSTIDGLVIGSIYALFALGYTMVYGVLKLINFAHGEVFMVGTVAIYGVVDAIGIQNPPGGIALVGLLLLCAATGMAASGLTAVGLERVAYRPLRKRGASRLAALISAIGMSFVLQQIFSLFVLSHGHPSQPKTDSQPIAPIMGHTVIATIGKAQITTDDILVVVTGLLMMVALDRLVATTRLGRGIRAVAQDPETAILMGVNIDRIILYTFLIGGAMAGFASAMFDVHFSYTAFDIGQLNGIKAFTAAVLGGIGNLRGALLGGLFIGLLEKYGASIFASQWENTVVFALLVIVLLFRPTGILGESLARARA
ncbi:MAG TPA: branched-chain amino acid ABC transporter permease [Acidimicrobiales bacterium]|nr:branched-chain amino acid ABC transporter permease [Acidimicrobiales bacterium]